MNPDYIALDNLDLLWAALLLAANLSVSVVLRLGLAGRLVWAAARMTIQLLLVGLVLEWVFALRNPGVILAIGAAMAAIAGVTAVNRTQRRFPGVYLNALVAVMASSALVTGVAVKWIVAVDPWYEPQYLIPLLGMVLGNALNGISLGLDRLMENLVARRALVEAELALGATRWEALHQEVREAVRTGMIPITNSMLVMGVVSLPGMMTGQILAGAAPSEAVKYQIVIVFMIAASVALATLGVVLLAYLRLTDRRHAMRADVLRNF